MNLQASNREFVASTDSLLQAGGKTVKFTDGKKKSVAAERMIIETLSNVDSSQQSSSYTNSRTQSPVLTSYSRREANEQVRKSKLRMKWTERIMVRDEIREMNKRRSLRLSILGIPDKFISPISKKQ